jgi:hypothetical protein
MIQSRAAPRLPFVFAALFLQSGFGKQIRKRIQRKPGV